MQAWLPHFRDHPLAETIKVPDQHSIFEAGSPALQVMVVARGAAEVYHRGPDGREHVAAILPQGALLGSVECFSGEARYLASLRALGGTELCALGADHIRRACKKNPALHGAFLEDMAIGYAQSMRLQGTALDDVEVKLARLVLAYLIVQGSSESEGGWSFRIRRSQEALATAVGSSERQIRRIANRWAKNGVIDKQGHRWIVGDLVSLAQLAGPEDLGLLYPRPRTPVTRALEDVAFVEPVHVPALAH